MNQPVEPNINPVPPNSVYTPTVPGSEVPSEERVTAALSHFFGWIVALIVWLIQKDKSRFVRFQAAQAIAFDLIVGFGSGAIVAIIMVLLFAIMFALMLAGGYAASSNPSDNTTYFLMMLPAFMPMGVFCIVFPLVFILMGARIWAAISVLTGRNFHYPVIGKWVENILK